MAAVVGWFLLQPVPNWWYINDFVEWCFGFGWSSYKKAQFMNSSKKSHLIMILLITSGAGCPHAGFESVPLKLFAVKKFLCDVFLHTVVIFGNAWKSFYLELTYCSHRNFRTTVSDQQIFWKKALTLLKQNCYGTFPGWMVVAVQGL